MDSEKRNQGGFDDPNEKNTKLKYGVNFYTKDGSFGYSEYRDDLYEVLQLYVQDKNDNFRPTLWVLNGDNYVRVHDFNFSELSPDTYREYLAERVLATDDVLADVVNRWKGQAQDEVAHAQDNTQERMRGQERTQQPPIQDGEMGKASVTEIDIKYELERLDRQIQRLEEKVKLCREQIGQIRMQQEKVTVQQAEVGRKERKTKRDIPRENRKPPM